GDGGTPRRPAEFLRGFPVPIRSAAAMRRVVLPAAITAIPTAAVALRVHLIAVSAIDLISVSPIDIRIPVEVVINVDIHITAAPSTAPAPASAPHRAHCHSNSERNRHAGGVVAWGRIVNWRIRINRRAVNHGGVVTRNINHLRIRLFDNDNLFRLDYF